MQQEFRQLFDADLDGVWSAPGRVNLIGEHTDYNGGVALPFAIDRRTRIAVRLRDDRVVRVASAVDNRVFALSLDELDADFPDWTPYLIGVAKILIEHSTADPQEVRGFDAFVDSDIPIGVGVSSSHALECAAATALAELWRLPLSATDLIHVTHRVEHEVVGAPTGTLDQSAILLSEPDHAVLLDFGSDTNELIPLGFQEAGLEILLIDSTQRHSHASGGYGQRRRECETAARAAGVKALGEIAARDIESWKGRMPDTVFRRMRHIVTDSARARRVATLLRAGEPAAIGRLLTEGHHSERDDFEISTPAIDAAVDAALRTGALGARLTGGGFGGASIALVNANDSTRIAAAVRDSVEAAGHPSPEIYAVRPAAGARRDS